MRFGDANTMLAALVKGEVDAAPVPVPSVASVKDNPNVKLTVVNQLSFDYIGTNLRNPVLADKAVRTAMAYAINRKAIVTGLMSGYGTVVDTLFPKSHWAYPSNVKPIPYDPALAQKTLDDAGWKMSGGVRSKDGKALQTALVLHHRQSGARARRGADSGQLAPDRRSGGIAEHGLSDAGDLPAA